MKYVTIALGLLAAAPACAQDVLSEVSGNWAAPKNDGFYYRATLTPDGEYVRLRIYQGATPDLTEADLQLDNSGIGSLMTIGVDLVNELRVGPDGRLTIHASGADESYGFSEEIDIHYIDNQFTVVGYRQAITELNQMPDTAEEDYACEVKPAEGKILWAGIENPFPELAFEDLNAGEWNVLSAVELGLCPAIN
ncbi:MAG: hypothetical protein ACRCSU_14825 [Paracoccaceae bacterium]